MSTCTATLIEMFNKDMERAALEESTESLWGAIQKDLGETFLRQKICGVTNGLTKIPADHDLSDAQKQDVCSNKLPLKPSASKESPVLKAVPETELLLEVLNVNTTKQDSHDMLLTGNGASDKTKTSGSQESSVVATIHPSNLQTKNVMEQYPSNYNQRTPEHLHMLFGAVQTTADLQNDEMPHVVIHPMPSETSETKINGGYPIDYNQRTPEHLNSLFGVQNEKKIDLIIHPEEETSHNSKPKTNEHKLLGNYPFGYNQRTAEHLQSLFGAVQTTESQRIRNTQCEVSSKKAESRKKVPIIIGSYPKDYNKRTKEHFHFLFGANSQTQEVKDEEKIKKVRNKKERKSKDKTTDKQKRIKNKNNKVGQQPLNSSSTSFHCNTESKKTQKGTTGFYALFRIGRNKKNL